MNIYYPALMSMLFCLVMSAENSSFSAKDIILELLNLKSSESIPSLDLKSKEESRNLNSNEKSGSKSADEGDESEKFPDESGSENFHDGFKCENFPDDSKSEKFPDESVSEKFSDESGIENFSEESGSEHFNEESRNENSKKNNKILKNVNNESLSKCTNMKNKNKNSVKMNENKNTYKKIRNKNSIKKNGFKSSNPTRYLYPVETFHKAKQFEYPYHVIIIWKPDDRQLCQGALIKSRWVITSASCIYHYALHYKSISVLMGITSLEDNSVISHDVLKVVNFPEFISDQGLNDIALLMLDSDVVNAKNVEAVPIYKPYHIYHHNKKKCQFSTFSESTLYGKSVDFVFQENCDVPKVKNQTLPYFCASVDGSFIKSTSDITLGSPLVCGGVIYGIKSKNTLFTSVDNLIQWVDEKINQTSHTIKSLYSLDRVQEKVVYVTYN